MDVFPHYLHMSHSDGGIILVDTSSCKTLSSNLQLVVKSLDVSAFMHFVFLSWSPLQYVQFSSQLTNLLVCPCEDWHSQAYILCVSSGLGLLWGTLMRCACVAPMQSSREAVLWMAVHHKQKKALELFAREIAPAGTGMGGWSTGNEEIAPSQATLVLGTVA